MRERTIHLYLRALLSDKRKFKKEFLFSGRPAFGYSFTRIFGGLDVGLVKFERTNLTRTS